MSRGPAFGYVAAALIGATGGIQLIGLWVLVSALPRIVDPEGGQSGLRWAEQLDARVLVLGVASIVLTVLAGIAWGVWLHGLLTRFVALGLGDPPAKPRSALGWTLVPIYGHLYRMPQIVQDLHDSHAERGLGGRKSIVRAWRVLWIASGVTALGSRSLEGLSAAIATIVASILTLAAAAFAILLIRDLEAQQERRVAHASVGAGPEPTAA